MSNQLKVYIIAFCMTALPLASYANTFVFNPRTTSFKAYNDRGRLVKWGRASGGGNYCADVGRSCRTPAGVYSIQSMAGSGCRSGKYPLGGGGAPMPYCMFFSRNYAIHGSPHVPRRNVSHGCIRVKTRDARWLYYNFVRIGTKVVVERY